ncbi:MAG: TerC/Alx family metal homeostasis membrane protein [Acidobacteriaceae bacterium]
MTPTPLCYWIAFHLALMALLGVEYLLQRTVADTRQQALLTVAMWVVSALTLALVLARLYRPEAAAQYLAGYALEQALSLDNLFVFVLVFRLFQIPADRQPRVLFWGVAGAIFLRGVFIAGGVELLNRLQWIQYLLAVLLLLAAFRLLRTTKAPPAEEITPAWLRWLIRWRPVSADVDHFLVVKDGRRTATLLLLAVVAVELADTAFAADSIPAVLSVTRQPFLAYTSNIMAVMGLRSLYVLLAAGLARLRYLHVGLAAVLGFAALKMLASDWIPIGPGTTLAVITGLVGVTVGASLLRRPT